MQLNLGAAARTEREDPACDRWLSHPESETSADSTPRLRGRDRLTAMNLSRNRHQRSQTSVMPATEVAQHRFQPSFGNMQKAPSPPKP